MSVENENVYNDIKLSNLKSLFESWDFDWALDVFSKKSSETIINRDKEIEWRLELVIALDSYNEEQTLWLSNIFNQTFNISNEKFQALA